MKFRVGPWVYRVRVTEGLAHDGKAAAGLCDWEERVIWIEAAMPPKHRLPTLLHEIRHAWQQAMGRSADDESDARQVASFTADVWRQLERQGGEPALMRMTPDGVVDHAAPVDAPGEPRAAQCPRCGGLLDLPIRTGATEYDAAHARLTACRSADCDFCSHTVSWREAVTSAGVPTGQVLGEPTVLRASVRA